MLIRGPRTTPTHENHGVHDGEGYAIARRLFTRADFKSNLFFFTESTLQPGSSYGDHLHRGDEEVYYIVEGHGLMQVDGEEREVGPGDAILTPSGSHHSLSNTGGGVLKVLVIGAEVTERPRRCGRLAADTGVTPSL
jgi:mannose-6-phosphate isomerase-like protein (cupin superfamily)